MKRKIELLAPGGDVESVKAAIAAGADAIYLGLNTFNARYRATNIEFDDLAGILKLAHRNSCEIFITINIIIIESEIRSLINLLNKLINTDIDGVIVQDLGLFYLLSTYYKRLKIHASTQLTTHNAGQIKFLSQLNATRVNLSRELNLAEIKALTQVGHEHGVLSEVFVHGSNCLSFSGICYMSSVLEGKSGNRGRCSQPCRDQYHTTAAGKNFPLNLKDNSAFNDLRELYEAGVDSVKIEGRIKKFHYVYTVVNSWRKLLDNFTTHNQDRSDDTDLYRVFNRDFSNAFLQDTINHEMFIDNPRDNSARHFSAVDGNSSDEAIEKTKWEIHGLRTEIIAHVKKSIAALSAENFDVKSGEAGEGRGVARPRKVTPIETPRLKKQSQINLKPRLSILISSRQQLNLCRETRAEIFYQLPSCFAVDYSELVELFSANPALTPWFPSILIGEDYRAAVDILDQVQPQTIVTNNTGIAYEAYQRGIDWIAGPSLNSSNSFTLHSLKENFNCAGAFLSNEINKDQIKKIVTPADFKLYYSIYHPILLLTSRHCLLQPIEGCDKNSVDQGCLLDCSKSSSITHDKFGNLLVDKTAGCYQRIYHQHNFLNSAIVTDLPNMFSNFLIDLSEVETRTKVEGNKVEIVRTFEQLLAGDPNTKKELEKMIQPTTHRQYQKGI